MILVNINHVRKALKCASDARVRKFCVRHGFDYSQFLATGIPVDQVEATGDAMALRVAEVARGRQ